MIHIILTNFVIMLVLFTILWAMSVRIKNASIIDIFWGIGCSLPAVLTYMRAETADPRAIILASLASLWGMRLSIYLALRNLGHGEDFRYIKMREKVGNDRKFAVRSLPTIFILQCVIAFFVSLPTQVGQFGGSTLLGTGSGALGITAFLGILIFIIGLSFETIGDYQLQVFKKNPANKGKLMDQGLWAWTRHPNYFGDACVWTGLTLIAFESTYGIFTTLSPIVMVYSLYAISGKALLERSMSKRYPEYENYKKRVSGFFPRPPQKA